MTKSVLFFLAAFILGATATLITRTALHRPYEAPSSTTAESAHTSTQHEPSPAPSPSIQTINTICPICGMDVDPSLKPATYQGKLIGFGCRACPPKFAREPDRYGPSALANKVVEN